VGGVVEEDEALLSEVANLVEKPTAVRGTYDDVFLELPEQVLISVMKRHQRAFPVQRGDSLLPYFILVRNGGEEHLDIVTRGNEQVIGARFADAAYFIRRDLEHPLESFIPRLDTLTFQTELGSMLDKTRRVERLTGILAKDLELGSEEKKIALRAAQLSKADLVSYMVVEMTSLQGEMGREYAKHQGEPESVAQAILDHYLPRFAGDRMPSSIPGLIIGIADRMDTLVGLFAAGIQPTGARDPFAMRRTAIGLIQNLIAHEVRFDLHRGLKLAAEGLPIEASEEEIQASVDFIVAREQGHFLREGYRHDAVESVLAAQGYDPAGAAQALEALEKWRARQDWDEILQAYARCARITRAEKEIYTVDPKRFVEKGERSLFKELGWAEKATRESGSVDDFFSAFTPLIPIITTFFEDILVMADEKELRDNRLGLLQRIVALAVGVMDLSRLEGF
jgi:glycyl-tRNA synthetase